MNAPTTPAQKLLRARKLIQQARAARGRASWRTGGTVTHGRELEKAALYEDEADALLDEVAASLSGGDAA